LQPAQVEQSQHVHCSHPHTPVLQQLQHALADAAKVIGEVATAIRTETMNSKDFIIYLHFKDYVSDPDRIVDAAGPSRR